MADELKRRDFLAAAAAAAAACALCPLAHAADDDDDDDDAGATPLPPGPVDAGPLTQYGKDGSFDALAKSKQIILVRQDGKLSALTAICTHKKAIVHSVDDQLVCPKHSSRFDLSGKAVPKPNGKMGPARKPLTHFSISVNDKGHVIVDTSKPVDASAADASIKA